MKNLLNHQQSTLEKSIYSTEIHWISNVIPVLFMVAGLIGIPLTLLVIYFFFQAITETGFWIPSFTDVIAFGLLFLFFKGAYSFLLNRSLKIALYESQITLKSGVFSKNITDISLNKYEGLQLYQSFLGRLLDFGSLHVTTGGVSQKYKIKKPLELRKHINNQINNKL